MVVGWRWWVGRGGVVEVVWFVEVWVRVVVPFFESLFGPVKVPELYPVRSYDFVDGCKR